MERKFDFLLCWHWSATRRKLTFPLRHLTVHDSIYNIFKVSCANCNKSSSEVIGEMFWHMCLCTLIIYVSPLNKCLLSSRGENAQEIFFILKMINKYFKLVLLSASRVNIMTIIRRRHKGAPSTALCSANEPLFSLMEKLFMHANNFKRYFNIPISKYIFIRLVVMFLKYFPLLWLGYATSNIYFVCCII